MSDISRKALIEWAKIRKDEYLENAKRSGFSDSIFRGKADMLQDLIAYLKSGAFPSTESEGEATRLRAALIKAEKFISNVLSFCGEGLEVVNWHQNGDTEPLDNIFESNMDGDELDVIRQALSSHREEAEGFKCSTCEDTGKTARYGNTSKGEPNVVVIACTRCNGAGIKDGRDTDD